MIYGNYTVVVLLEYIMRYLTVLCLNLLGNIVVLGVFPGESVISILQLPVVIHVYVIIKRKTTRFTLF